MFKVELKKPKLAMEIDLNGRGKVYSIPVNGVVFEFINDEVYLNGYITLKEENESFDRAIKEQLSVIKMMDVSKIKDDNLKKQLKHLNKTKISSIKVIKNAKFATKIVQLVLGEVEQVQFYVNLGNYLLIIGLKLQKEDEESKTILIKKNIQVVIDAINSIKIWCDYFFLNRVNVKKVGYCYQNLFYKLFILILWSEKSDATNFKRALT